MKYLTLLIIALTLISQNAIAAGYTGTGTILKLSSIASSGGFELYGSFSDPDNCNGGTPPEKYIVGLHSTDTDLTRQSKYSMIMSAYLSGTTIELYVDGCTGINPTVKNVYLPSR